MFDTRAGHSDAHGWAPECPDMKNYKWRLNPVWHRMLLAVPIWQQWASKDFNSAAERITVLPVTVRWRTSWHDNGSVQMSYYAIVRHLQYCFVQRFFVVAVAAADSASRSTCRRRAELPRLSRAELAEVVRPWHRGQQISPLTHRVPRHLFGWPGSKPPNIAKSKSNQILKICIGPPQ